MTTRADRAASTPTVSTLTLDELVARAAALASERPRTLLGIVGAPGAGKSTLCTALTQALAGRAVVVGMDGFHLDDEVLLALGRRDRKGASDTFDVPGYISMLHRLSRAAEEVTYAPRFDRNLEASRGSAVSVPRSIPLVITEGNYLLHNEGLWAGVRSTLHEAWYLDVASPERVRRLVERRLSCGDTPQQARSWVEGVDESNASVVLAGRDRADLVVQLADPIP